MSEALDEQVSALVDDELDSSELPLLMRQLAASESLSGRLERYYLIRDAVRRELPVSGCGRLADQVASALEAEPAHAGGRRRHTAGHALKPAAGLAIAASVAVLAVGLWPAGQSPSTPQPESLPSSNSVAVQSSQSGAMRVSTGSSAGVQTTSGQTGAVDDREWDRLDPRVQDWLNGYIVDHSEHAGSARLGGMINYARIAGQEPKEQ